MILTVLMFTDQTTRARSELSYTSKAMLLLLIVLPLSYSFANTTPLTAELWATLEPSKVVSCNGIYHPGVQVSSSVDLNTKKVIEEVELEVKAAIKKRVSYITHLKETYKSDFTFKEHKPLLLDKTGTPKVDVSNGLFLPYGQNLMVGSRTEVNEILIGLVGQLGGGAAGRWVTVRRSILDGFYTPENKKLMNNLLNNGEANINYSAIPGFDSFLKEKGVENFSIFPNPNFKLPLKEGGGSNQGPFFKAISHLVTDPDFIYQLSDRVRNKIIDRIRQKKIFPISEAVDLEYTLQQEWIMAIVKPEQNQLKEIATRITKAFGDGPTKQAALDAPTGIPGEMQNWDAYLTQDAFKIAEEWFDSVPVILERALDKLRTQFPIGEREESDIIIKDILNKDYLSKDTNKKVSFKDYFLNQFFSKDGLSLEIPSSQIKIRYDLNFGTSFLESNIESPKDGFITTLQHGAGTSKSSGQSFKALVPAFISYGFTDVLAYDLPFASMGLPLEDLKSTIVYINLIHMKLHNKSKVTLNKSHIELPIVYGGRSMGSADGVLHSALFEGKDNPIDAYWLGSFCNPRTIGKQLVNVYEQLKAGIFSGVIQESLQNASSLSKEFIELFEMAKKKNPKIFETFGNNLLFFQGNADADNGPTVMDDLSKFLKDFAPFAHFFPFILPQNQRVFYEKLMNGEEVYVTLNGKKVKVTEDMLEAQHYIHSTRDNNEIANPRSQTLQANAAIYAFMDYLADGPGKDKDWPNERDAIAQKKFKALQERRGGSIFNWYLRLLKINPHDVEQVVNPIQNNADLLHRMAWVRKYWIEERIRVVKAYKKIGLLPSI